MLAACVIIMLLLQFGNKRLDFIDELRAFTCEKHSYASTIDCESCCSL